MLFNTLDFVIFFITVLTTFVAIKRRTFHHVFLLAASYFFFYYSSNYLITLLIFTTVWDFYFGQLIYKTDSIARKKILLITSLAGNLGLLGFFKYADFAITQFNFVGQYFDIGSNITMLNLALPIAISFYTFHSITYTVGIYRRQLEPAKTFTEYAIFVAFFPQLVAGPILRAKEFLPQLREKIVASTVGGKFRLIVIEKSNLKYGVTLMIFGFLKKMFFADNIAPLVNDVFSNPVGHDSLTIILTTLAFGIQIYCDFSGYSDIALGAAWIMGFKIPI
ncbi:MAG: MBOAT family protein, partial [Nitrososphaeria archaeon]|nr:MBOAT family protein [Nitrososphaeria archaeon]NDF25849.1 MBOAT family protein [Nitrososphaerota archaeon]